MSIDLRKLSVYFVLGLCMIAAPAGAAEETVPVEAPGSAEATEPVKAAQTAEAPAAPAAPAAVSAPTAPAAAAAPAEAAAPSIAVEKLIVDPDHQIEIGDFKERWGWVKSDYIKKGRANFKRAQAEAAEIVKQSPALDARLGDGIGSIAPLETELSARTAELVKQGEAKKQPSFVAMLEEEAVTRGALAKELTQQLTKDRDDLTDITQKMTAWQARDAELTQQGDALDAEADKALAEVNANANAPSSGEWYDLMVEQLNDMIARSSEYKEQSDILAEEVSLANERMGEMTNHLISLKEIQGEWRNLLELRTKEAAELAKV